MKVKEIMERIGITETHINRERIDITANQRFYSLPNDLLQIKEIRCKNHLNSKDEYRSIPRTIYKPLVKDADGV